MKNQLRNQARGVSPPSRKASEAIQSWLLKQDWWVAAFQVGLYRATPSEPATDILLADLLARGARVAVPVRQGAEYGWGWVEEHTRWLEKAHGILEPNEPPMARPDDLRVIVVPGLAFDVQGGRLGHGRGHFDRLLASCRALLVGLSLESRLVAEVPMEPHDIRMDVVVTEKQVRFAATAAAKLEQLTG